MNRLRALLACVLLAPFSAHAAGKFFWDCEATTLGAGSFSAGDTTATASGGMSISASSPLEGSNSCLTTDAADYYIFDPASIAVVGEGGFAIKFRWTTTAPAATAFSKPFAIVDSADNDSVGFTSDTTPHMRLQIRKQGNAAVNLTGATTTIAADTTYYMTSAWDSAGDRRYVKIYNSSCSLLESVVDTATDLGNDIPGNFDQIRAGNASSATNVLRFDHVIVTSDYDDDLESACSWTQYKPTYTAGPTNGTFTDTTLPFTYTSDHTGTTYAAACTNGQTVTTFANLKAGTCSGGAAVGTGSDANVQTVGNTVTITGLSAGTTYDVYVGQEDALGWQSDLSSLADRATTSSSIPANFTSGPSVAAAANGYTISGTLNGDVGTLTAYAVGVAPGDGAPTCTQIKAGQNAGGSAAVLAASETWTTDVGDSFALATASKPPSLDVHICGSDGTNNTSVTSAADQLRSTRSGFAFVTMASVSATGICDYDAYFTPDCAIGDVFEYESVTNEDAGCAVSIDTAGDVTLTPDTGSECDNQRTFELSYEDVSSATDGLFTAPTVGNFATDDTAYINNTAPFCELEEGQDLFVLTEDEAMTPDDLTAYCSDDDADTLTFSITSGTLPNGTSLSGTGNKDWSGTPDTEDETGAAITTQACDPAGECDTFDRTVYVINTWTVTDCDGLTAEDCGTAIIADAPWRVLDAGVSVAGLACSAETPGTIVSQDPAAAAEAGSFDVISVTEAVACGDPATERKVVFELTDVSGLLQWVDYIPVAVIAGCSAGRYDEDGCWAVTPLASSSGKVAWVDYIPVYAVPESINKWRYEANGFIPVDTLTP